MKVWPDPGYWNVWSEHLLNLGYIESLSKEKGALNKTLIEASNEKYTTKAYVAYDFG